MTPAYTNEGVSERASARANSRDSNSYDRRACEGVRAARSVAHQTERDSDSDRLQAYDTPQTIQLKERTFNVAN